MCNRRYIVFGGYVTSQNDGQRHYIPAIRVMELYKLKREQCFLINDQDNDSAIFLAQQHPHGYHYLYPDPTGQYTCPRGEPGYTVFKRVDPNTAGNVKPLRR